MTQTLKTIYQSAKEAESELPKAESELAKNAPTVSELQEELRKSKLYATLLEEIIALNEKEYGIEFRKKLGRSYTRKLAEGKNEKLVVNNVCNNGAAPCGKNIKIFIRHQLHES